VLTDKLEKVPSILHYKCADPRGILRDGKIKPSSIFGGVSLTANPDLRSHGRFKITLKAPSHAKPAVYIQGGPGLHNKDRPFSDHLGNYWVQEEIDQLAPTGRALSEEHQGFRQNPIFQDEKEWRTTRPIDLQPGDIKSISYDPTLPQPSHSERQLEKIKNETKTAAEKMGIPFQEGKRGGHFVVSKTGLKHYVKR
jgi:hypothetical protein